MRNMLLALLLVLALIPRLSYADDTKIKNEVNAKVTQLAVFSALSEAAPGHPQRMNLLDVIAVGGKGVRGVEFKKITMTQVKGDIRITVPALEYGPNDALCCPSIKSEANFIVRPHVGGRIREIGNPKR